MRPICHLQLKSDPGEDASPELHKLFMSLLGAVAYASQTRVDAQVFICALHRHNSKPKVEHCPTQQDPEVAAAHAQET